MKLYVISQGKNRDYDTYDTAVVSAPDEEIARNMNPADGKPMTKWGRAFSSWCSSPDDVSVRYLGEAADSVGVGVVCASFNSG